MDIYEIDPKELHGSYTAQRDETFGSVAKWTDMAENMYNVHNITDIFNVEAYNKFIAAASEEEIRLLALYHAVPQPPFKMRLKEVVQMNCKAKDEKFGIPEDKWPTVRTQINLYLNKEGKAYKASNIEDVRKDFISTGLGPNCTNN